jgi:outer membrane protein assembly factor BamB
MPRIKINTTLIIAIVSVVFAVILLWWVINKNQPYNIVERIPGMDNRPKVSFNTDSVVIGQYLDTFSIVDEILPGSWPHFRGKDFDNISKDETPLAEDWDSSGPQIVWRTSLGEGYAGPAVLNGRVYLLDYNEKKKADMLRCFSLKSGKELWRRWYNVDLKRNHGYSRTIPSVTDKWLVSIGPRSHVMCLDPLNGKLLWTIDLEKKYGIPGKENGRITPDFFTGQCPLIDDNIAVIAPGGKAIMIGVDCKSGKILWETPNPDTMRMSHCSIMPATVYGKKMYIYNAIGGVIGVSAEGEDRGRLMWKTTEWSPSTVAASPLFLGNNEFAVFGNYGAGGARIRVKQEGSGYKAEVIEQHKSVNGLASDQQTPILIGNYIWTVMPENSGALKKQLVCFNKSDLLKPVWSSGKDNRYGRGLGPYIASGDKIFLLDDDGKLYYFLRKESSVSLIASHKILDGIEAWGPMAIASNFLLMRDSKNLLCLNIGRKNQKHE